MSFIIVGRGDEQDAEDLLEVIKERIDSSSYAIFDATRDNANVSLEYGYAEAQDIPRAIYISTHRAARGSTKDAPIISDLAGKRRNQYAQERGLQRLLAEFSKQHSYTVRFDRFVSAAFRSVSTGTKRRSRALALKVIHNLDRSRDVRRADIVERLLADPSRYTRDEADRMIVRLHRAGLIRSQQGPFARVRVS